MRTKLACCIVGLIALRLSAQTKPAAHNFDKWEKEIAAYEQKDRTTPPPKGGMLFTGASSIRKWTTLDEDFAGLPVINRGFGGSEIADSTHFAERIIFPYEPKMVLLRAGGNDIHAGKTPEQVFDDYTAFVAKVHERLPDGQIVFISQSPSESRWKEADADKQLNTLVEAYTRQHPELKLAYIETYDMVLGADGKPRPELFVADKLHFSPEGYKLLAERVRPYLKSDATQSTDDKKRNP